MSYSNSRRLFAACAVIFALLILPSFHGIEISNAAAIGASGSNGYANSDNQNAKREDAGASVSAYIILFNGRPTSDDVAQVESHHGTVGKTFNLINGMAVLLPDNMVDALAQNNPRIKHIESDVEVQATDLNLDKQIRADQVWTRSSYPSTGTGVPIAVLDTGIDVAHPEFSGRIALCRSEILNKDGVCDDQNGHGTHTAGIASASGVNSQAKGVAPNSKLYIDQVLDSTGNGPMSSVIAGIEWSVAKGAKVISMSLTTTSTTLSANCDSTFPSLTQAINNATAAGVTVVAAAGNSGTSGVGAPGCISSSIAVGAVDSSDNIASFSSRGSAMADHGIVAPGVNIYSSYKGGTYATASGTSMATPAVAGAAALMLGIDNSLSPQQVRNLLFQNTCNQSTSPTCSAISATPSNVYGFGRVDTLASTSFASAPPANSSPDFTLSSASGALTIAKGKSGAMTITASSVNSFTSSNIGLSASVSPAISGISYIFSPSSLSLSQGTPTASSMLTISLPRSVSPGVYTLTITATDNNISGTKQTHSIQVTLNVTKK